MRKKTAIKAFVKECLEAKSNQKMDLEINQISDEQAETIRRLLGINLKGYARILGKDTILYQAAIYNIYIYVEEIREKRK